MSLVWNSCHGALLGLAEESVQPADPAVKIFQQPEVSLHSENGSQKTLPIRAQAESAIGKISLKVGQVRGGQQGSKAGDHVLPRVIHLAHSTRTDSGEDFIGS